MTENPNTFPNIKRKPLQAILEGDELRNTKIKINKITNMKTNEKQN